MSDPFADIPMAGKGATKDSVATSDPFADIPTIRSEKKSSYKGEPYTPPASEENPNPIPFGNGDDDKYSLNKQGTTTPVKSIESTPNPNRLMSLRDQFKSVVGGKPDEESTSLWKDIKDSAQNIKSGLVEGGAIIGKSMNQVPQLFNYDHEQNFAFDPDVSKESQEKTNRELSQYGKKIADYLTPLSKSMEAERKGDNVSDTIVRGFKGVGTILPTLAMSAIGLEVPTAVATAGAFGLGSAYDTEESYKRQQANGAPISDEDIQNAKILHGTIDGLGMFAIQLVTAGFGKLAKGLTIEGKPTIDTVLEAMTNEDIVKPFMSSMAKKLALDTSIFTGQAFADRAVDQHYGAEYEEDAGKVFKEAVGGAVAFTLSGVPTSGWRAYKQSRYNSEFSNILNSVDAPEEARANAVKTVAVVARQAGVPKSEVGEWVAQSALAINEKKPIFNFKNEESEPPATGEQKEPFFRTHLEKLMYKIRAWKDENPTPEGTAEAVNSQDNVDDVIHTAETIVNDAGTENNPTVLTHEDVVKHLEPINERMTHGSIEAVEDVSDLPKDVKKSIGPDGHEVEGVWVGNGRVYIVSKNIEHIDRLHEVVAHELIGHLAPEEIMNPVIYSNAIKSVQAMEKAGNTQIKGLARIVDARQPDLDPTTPDPLASNKIPKAKRRTPEQRANTRAKEIMAMAVETGRYRSSPVLRRVVGDITYGLKKFLIGRGMDNTWVNNLNDHEVHAMLRDGERKLFKGTIGLANGTERGLLFSKRNDWRAEPTREIPSELHDVNHIESARELAGSKSFRKGRDLKMALDDRIRAEAKKLGVNLSEKTPETLKYLSELAEKEIRTAIKKNPNAIGWYDSTLKEAFRILGHIHPELAHDKEAQFVFKWALAVTSNGMKVDKNLELAEKAYEHYKATGKLPENIGIGNATNPINEGMKAFNKLHAKLGMDQLREFMTSFKTVKELKADGHKINGEDQGTLVYGASILGPKIGNGFFMNLHGKFDQLTMDRWLVRTFGRWTGTLVNIDKSAIAGNRKKLKSLISMLPRSELNKFKDILGMKTLTGDIDEVATQIQKASMNPELRAKMSEIAKADPSAFDELLGTAKANQKRISIGDEIRKMGNGLTKALVGQKEAPANGDERNFIRAIFDNALQKVVADHPDLTKADAQALLWYPEKKLYESAKEDDAKHEYEDDEAPDYANASAKLARAKGVEVTPKTGERSGNIRSGKSGEELGPDSAKDGKSNQDQEVSPLFSRGVNVEVAPHPKDKEAVDRFNALSEERKIELTRKVADPAIHSLMSDMEIKDYSIEHTVGGYQGNTQPSIVLHFGDNVPYEHMLEASHVLGEVWNQEATIVFDEHDKSGGNQGYFVKVIPDRKLDYQENADLFKAITKAFPKAEGFTARDGGLVFGHYPDNEGKFEISHEEFLKGVQDAFKTADTDYNAETKDSTFRSDWIEPVSIKETRYGQDNEALNSQSRDGRRVSGGQGYIDSLKEESRRGIENELLKSVKRKDEPDAGSDRRLRESRYGVGTEGSSSVRGIHYSQQERQSLSGSFYGKGMRGGERRRIDRESGNKEQTHRIHFYVNEGDGIVPESGVGTKAHVTNLDNLYDLKADHLGLLDRGYEKYKNWDDAFNHAEQQAMDRGYDGIYIPKAQGKQGVAVLIGSKHTDVPVTPLYSKKQTETPEFKKWFADSKVVDEEGEPKVMYHGTPKDFNIFHSSSRGAFFVTENPEFASAFSPEGGKTLEESTGSNVLPLYVKARNPFDFENPDHVQAVLSELNTGRNGGFTEHYLNNDNNWQVIEDRDTQRAIKKLGFDSFYVNEGGDKNLGLYHPNQVKSAIGNNGEFNPENPSILKSQKKRDTWYYSPLERGIESAPDRIFGKAPQVKLWLASNASKLGVKDEEIQWSGVNDWLDLKGKEKVSKQDVLDYLKDGGVQLEEVVHGFDFNDIERAFEKQGYRIGRNEEDSLWYGDKDGQVDFEDLPSDLHNLIIKHEFNDQDTTKYSQYTLEGGKNYKELLITFPIAETEYGPKLTPDEAYDQLLELQNPIHLFQNGKYVKTLTEDWQFLEHHSDIFKGKYDVYKHEYNQSKKFKSKHWDQPNVLAHIRFNDRTDADGNKVLFVEELQSDWHQKGRKDGYVTSSKPEYTIETDPNGVYRIKDINNERFEPNVNNQWFSGFITREQAEEAMQQKTNSLPRLRGDKGVPDAPFKDTKAWTGLAMKRMISYAIEHGYDKIAFVNGDQSAERYDLSEQIDRIDYSKNEDGGYDISAIKGKSEVFSEEGISLDRISEVVGKDIASKIEAGEGEPSGAVDKWESEDDDRQFKSLSGIDLKVGGEGMKNFYDKMVPQVANDLLRKLGGGKVEPIDFDIVSNRRTGVTGVTEHPYITHQPLEEPFEGNVKIEERATGNIVFSGPRRKAEEFIAVAVGNATRSKGQLGFTITDKMREGASDGMPLFSRKKMFNSSRDFIKKITEDFIANPSIKGFTDGYKKVKENIVESVAPMSVGSDQARALAKDFANAERSTRWQWAMFDELLKSNFTPEQLEKMWIAGDQENVLRMEGKKSKTKGLNSLSHEERVAVERLHSYGEELLQRAKDVGMFKGEGLPYWTPRMAVMIGEDGDYYMPPFSGEGGGSSEGKNVTTTSQNLKQRKYLKASETEEAMKAKLGDEANLVRNIRTMPMAMARLERAIAGRELVNGIKKLSKKTGTELTSASEKDGFFTIDHPAFKTFAPRMEERDGKWTPVLDQSGEIVFDKKPIYVSNEFRGPLKAIMSQKNGAVYNGLMTLKAKTMGIIMYSPLIHNAVEWGRAMPIMPMKVLTFKVYFEGNKVKKDPAQMLQALKDGLVPIGHRGATQDLTGIMEDPSLKVGRSWTAQILGKIADQVSESAGEAVRRGVDTAGDFWHNKLLWDRIGDLQAGIYANMKADLIHKGFDEKSAGVVSAHFANRFAGALPNEAMSANARKIANLALFSRTFTLGNLGVLKDAFTGLPKEVRAQLSRDVGELAMRASKNIARREAISAILFDMGLMLIGNSLLQDAMNYINGDDLDKIEKGYLRRLKEYGSSILENPLNLIGNLDHLSSTADNEPTKQGRIKYGTDADGTALYFRMPIGKIGEEFTGWLGSPLQILKNKEGTILRPLTQILSNDKGFGMPIYDNEAKLLSTDTLRNVGRVATHLVKAQLPFDALVSAYDLARGKGNTTDSSKVFGPLVGLTTSKGSQGGPAVGEMYQADKAFQTRVSFVMEDVKRAMKEGDQDKAVELLLSTGMGPNEVRSRINSMVAPQSRLNKGAVKKFNQHSTDEQKDRFNNAIGR